MNHVRRPWAAVIVMLIGFFMILVDSTIVSVANLSIMKGLNSDLTATLWATSAYLLAIAVPLLLAGRLGDRFGPKPIFLLGMAMFTFASLWCGLSSSIGMLIAARVAQGLGAALMSPQTMAVITRIFPPQHRGGPMGAWGATSGIALLVGPLLGGVLVDNLGWESIFLVNVPIGVIGLILGWIYIPKLPTNAHSFDLLGVALSAAGLFLVVFGIQEGESHQWGRVFGAVTIPEVIGVGVLLLVAFVWWQMRNQRDPLMPIEVFKDRNFSLGNAAITLVGFSVTSAPLILMIYVQAARGMDAIEAAMILVPMALLGGGLAPVAGKLANRINPRHFAVCGMLLLALAIFLYSRIISPTGSFFLLWIPSAVMGVANAGIWGPIALSTTRGLQPRLAGAGAGVYNVTRQIGAVIGAAAITALFEARVAATFHITSEQAAAQQGGGQLTGAAADSFTTAASQTLLLPAAVALIGTIIVAFFAAPKAIPHAQHPRDAAEPATTVAAEASAVPIIEG